jgi:hypothetical protein
MRRDWGLLSADQRFESMVAYTTTIVIGLVILTALYRLTRDPAITATLSGKAVRDASGATDGPFPLVIISRAYLDPAPNAQWKGFKPRTAVGLTLEHAQPAAASR